MHKSKSLQKIQDHPFVLWCLYKIRIKVPNNVNSLISSLPGCWCWMVHYENQSTTICKSFLELQNNCSILQFFKQMLSLKVRCIHTFCDLSSITTELLGNYTNAFAAKKRIKCNIIQMVLLCHLIYMYLISTDSFFFFHTLWCCFCKPGLTFEIIVCIASVS